MENKTFKDYMNESIDTFKEEMDKLVELYENNQEQVAVYDAVLIEYQEKYCDEPWYCASFIHEMFNKAYCLTWDDEMRRVFYEEENIYDYIAYKADGSDIHGKVKAYNAKNAVSKVRELGLFPTHVILEDVDHEQKD